jgi:hypothetical protein
LALVTKLEDYRNGVSGERSVDTLAAGIDAETAFDTKYIHNFESLCSLFMERCGVSFLSLDCVFFVWDQGFIAGVQTQINSI